MLNSERLNAIESLVPNGTRLLDIGSDHGLLPLDLLQSGRIVSAFVTDINEGPLLHSKRQLARFCAANDKKVKFALSDGFNNVPFGTYDVAAICGMGGELIARIIADGGEKAKCTLVLQPMTMCDKLRQFLWDNGYAIEKELYPTEGKRAYVVMLVKYTGKKETYTDEECYIGKIRPFGRGYATFLSQLERGAENRLKGALLSANEASASKEQRLLKAIRELS